MSRKTLVAIFLGIVLNAVAGGYFWMSIGDAADRVERHERTREELLVRRDLNLALIAEREQRIRSLNDDPVVVEREARRVFNYVAEGDVVFRFREN